jgi:hypothetical protein
MLCTVFLFSCKTRVVSSYTLLNRVSIHFLNGIVLQNCFIPLLSFVPQCEHKSQKINTVHTAPQGSWSDPFTARFFAISVPQTSQCLHNTDFILHLVIEVPGNLETLANHKINVKFIML